MLTLGSLFDGLGTWQLVAKRHGIKPLWSSEIDDYPMAVSKHHFPDTKHLGDITKIDVDTLEPVDIITCSSPCQDLSVAGSREGLAGARSGLFKTAIELVHRLRERTGKPRFFVWENVVGGFVSNKGLDFRTIIEEITKAQIPMPSSGRWAQSGMVEWGASSLAWRTLDAQYWGVPQRRRRIFLVADFGGRSAGEILFERKGLQGYSGKSEKTQQGTSTIDEASTNFTVYDMTHADEVLRPIRGGKMCTLNARMGTGGNQIPIIHTFKHISSKHTTNKPSKQNRQH